MSNTYIKINLKNLIQNFNFLKSKISKKTKFMAIVKASGYGSDATEIAKCLEKNKVDYLSVAYLREAIRLRKNGINSPILVLHPQLDDFKEIIEYNLEPNIYSFKVLNEFLNCRGQNFNYPIHVKFNTGLNRLGFLYSDVNDGVLLLLLLLL